ncbi:MAG: sodium-dependent bicarbonate transport family permease [Anaerolineales bacterium]|nr:sodium-dependent bicarbonate transport family permease [Anaerolineales bacterium]MDW8278888.1 sodium-dependent bicarbonate transport family permease [Anaerolineales bacterium]
MDLLLSNLLTPMVLSYVLGLTAGALGSDLRVPKQFYESLTIYLLFAIGFKGGGEIAHTGLGVILLPGLASVALGLFITTYAYGILRKLGKFSREDSSAIAAHYGSVSAVTFAAGIAMLDTLGIPYNGFMNALLALMESPAIILGVVLAGRARHLATTQDEKPTIDWAFFLREAFVSKSVVLLIGGMLIGWLSGESGYQTMEPLLITPFKAALSFFLLELGVVTSERLGDLRTVGPFLLGFGVLIPVVNGVLGILIGWLVGLNVGGATLLGALAASASYIAAPAAMRVAVPQANPALSLTAVLAVTFPFNIAIGLPLYLNIARWLFSR